MLFKSLAALIRSHVALLTEQGLVIPRQDAPAMADLLLQFKMLFEWMQVEKQGKGLLNQFIVSVYEWTFVTSLCCNQRLFVLDVRIQAFVDI